MTKGNGETPAVGGVCKSTRKGKTGPSCLGWDAAGTIEIGDRKKKKKITEKGKKSKRRRNYQWRKVNLGKKTKKFDILSLRGTRFGRVVRGERPATGGKNRIQVVKKRRVGSTAV